MKTIWILIYVHHGLIQEPEIFINEHAALKRKKTILKELNADYDEVEIFEKAFLSRNVCSHGFVCS